MRAARVINIWITVCSLVTPTLEDPHVLYIGYIIFMRQYELLHLYTPKLLQEPV